MDKLVIDCMTKGVKEKFFTLEEIEQQELEQIIRAEQELLDSLIPSDKEMLMAEVEIQTITILMEVGLI